MLRWVVGRDPLWQPDAVALRTALGNALYRVPDALRRGLPQPVRDGIRARVGPFAPWEAGFSHVAPPPGVGDVVAPPDFVGIGVQKAGTTWWFGLIAAHPDVAQRPGVHKERHFFARFATTAFGPERRRGVPPVVPAPAGGRAGEWTPDYVYQPWVVPLLHAAAPDARLLVMVRDPVERFVSGLAHSAATADVQRGTVVAEAFARGLYASQLRPWVAQFGAARLLVLQYERCVADPAVELARTYRFLGLDDGFRAGRDRAPGQPHAGAQGVVGRRGRARAWSRSTPRRCPSSPPSCPTSTSTCGPPRRRDGAPRAVRGRRRPGGRRGRGRRDISGPVLPMTGAGGRAGRRGARPRR